MSAEENKPAGVTGVQVWILAATTAVLFAFFFSGVSQPPKRYLYSEAVAAVSDRAAAAPATPESARTRADWLQDPLAVCAECHTAREAERFRRIITPMLAAASRGAWPNTASAPETSLAPWSSPGASLAGSR